MEMLYGCLGMVLFVIAIAIWIAFGFWPMVGAIVGFYAFLFLITRLSNTSSDNQSSAKSKSDHKNIVAKDDKNTEASETGISANASKGLSSFSKSANEQIGSKENSISSTVYSVDSEYKRIMSSANKCPKCGERFDGQNCNNCGYSVNSDKLSIEGMAAMSIFDALDKDITTDDAIGGI